MSQATPTPTEDLINFTCPKCSQLNSLSPSNIQQKLSNLTVWQNLCFAAQPMYGVGDPQNTFPIWCQGCGGIDYSHCVDGVKALGVWWQDGQAVGGEGF